MTALTSQRYHDALEEACRRLVAAGLLPERAGQPVRVTATSTWDLIDLDVGSELQKQWTERVRAGGRRPARPRRSAGRTGPRGWNGKAAEGFACGAPMTPVVFGTVNPGVLEDLVRFCVQLAGPRPRPLHPHPRPPRTTATPDHTGPHRPGPGRPG
jgi:hypothetical protein